MADSLDRLHAALAPRYSIERKFGSGGMAIVYLAHDVKHRRQVAIKVLRPDLAASLGPERFIREIEIAARLTHPHILPLFDSGEAEGFLYYVMPYVEGESLRDRLKRETTIAVAQAVRLTQQIAAALDYAHERGVIHRDIKPENVLLAGDQAIIADFGIARAVELAAGEHLTATGVAVGTPAYMSPEQAFGSSDVDARTDVYALGCVIYEMLSGRTPFEGATPQALLAMHAVDELGVDALIQPAVGREGDSVIVDVGLYDGRSQLPLWTQSFPSEVQSVLGVYRDITRRIANEVGAVLSSQAEARLAERPRVDPQAYDAVLKGHFHRQRYTPEDFTVASQYFEQALTIDSLYAPAHVGAAWVWAAGRRSV